MGKTVKAMLFTHNDLDGAGCTTIFELAFRHLEEAVEWATYICSNEGIDEKVLNAWQRNKFDKNTLICFADITPSRPVLETLVVNGYTNIKVFDHHVTAKWIEEILPNEKIVVENSFGQLECGTSLMYKFFSKIAEENPENPCGFNFSEKNNKHLKILSEYVEGIRSYDTFDWKLTNNVIAKKLNIMFQMLGTKIFSRKYTKRCLGLDSERDLFSKTEDEFISARIVMENDAIARYDISKLYYMDIKGLKTAIKFTGGDGIPVSEFSYKFLEKHPEIDMFIGINLAAGTFAYRTQRADLNVATFIAEPLNGGGHAKAAGSIIPIDMRTDILNKLVHHIDRFSKELDYEKVIRRK